MQLLFDTSQLLAINCPAFICSPRQLVDVVSDGSQLLGYLDCTRLVDFWRFHSIAHCPLFRKSWHAHLKGFRHLLNPFKFAVVHTKFNLPILFPVLSQKQVHPLHLIRCFISSYHACRRIGKLYIWYPNKLVFAPRKKPPTPHFHGGTKTLPF